MSTPPPTSLSAAEAKLRDAVQAAGKRRSLLTVVMVILCLVLAAYLGFAYWQISKVDADTVIVLAEQQVDPYLNQPASAWAQQLEDRAPDVIEQAGVAALEVPAMFSDRVVSYAEGKAEAELPELEKQFKEALSGLLDQVDETIRAEYPDGQIPDAEAEQMIDRVAEQFASSLEGEIDKIYQRYGEISGDMIGYLDELGQNQDLTETQKLHRQLLESFLALLQRVQARGAA
jgi:hypothetical protein